MTLSRIASRLGFSTAVIFGLIFSANVTANPEIKNIENIKKAIIAHVDGVGKFEVQTSPIPGLYLVIAPPRVLYISEDAKYIIDGEISNLSTRENLTSVYQNASRFAAVDAVKDSMIIFAPAKDKIKHTISVFTDMDCYYCQKLHKEMADYNRLGIEVRYLAYPRQGLHTPSYDKAVTVWCSKDQKTALTKAKDGGKLEPLKCEHPVDKHFALGNALGVRGTPALLLENGQLYPGYVPAARLSEALDRAKSNSASQ